MEARYKYIIDYLQESINGEKKNIIVAQEIIDDLKKDLQVELFYSEEIDDRHKQIRKSQMDIDASKQTMVCLQREQEQLKRDLERMLSTDFAQPCATSTKKEN